MFYDNLKNICDVKGVKMTPLLANLEISTGNISNWKKGTVPNAGVIKKIADALDVSTDQLLGNEQKEKAKPDERTRLEKLDELYEGSTKEERKAFWNKHLFDK